MLDACGIWEIIAGDVRCVRRNPCEVLDVKCYKWHHPEEKMGWGGVGWREESWFYFLLWSRLFPWSSYDLIRYWKVEANSMFAEKKGEEKVFYWLVFLFNILFLKNHSALISLFISAVEKIQFYISSVQISLCVWKSLVGTSGTWSRLSVKFACSVVESCPCVLAVVLCVWALAVVVTQRFVSASFYDIQTEGPVQQIRFASESQTGSLRLKALTEPLRCVRFMRFSYHTNDRTRLREWTAWI